MAVKRKYQKKHKINPISILCKEKALILKNYSVIECKIKNGLLYCYGTCQPTESSITYNYRIRYDAVKSPKIYVTSPEIEYHDDIHMYPKDNCLCLYHKTDIVWTTKHHIYDTIIPWTHEWFLFYEIYLITGIWEHPFEPHNRIKEEL